MNADETETKHCPTCHGSGIGRTGDPDTSRCLTCHGSGEVPVESDDCDDGEPVDLDDDSHFDPYAGGWDDDC